MTRGGGGRPNCVVPWPKQYRETDKWETKHMTKLTCPSTRSAPQHGSPIGASNSDSCSVGAGIEPPDVLSEALSYSAFNFELGRFEHVTARLRLCRPIPPFKYSRPQIRLRVRRSSSRRDRGCRQRARCSQRTARRSTKASPSRAGPESSDGDPEPPARPWQCWPLFEYKKDEEYRTANHMSGYQGGPVGCPP